MVDSSDAQRRAYCKGVSPGNLAGRLGGSVVVDEWVTGNGNGGNSDGGAMVATGVGVSVDFAVSCSAALMAAA